MADDVEQAVRQHPWVESMIRQGWFAKGVVYLLMGAVALTFVWRPRIDDQASPEGALGLVSHQPGGRLLLMVFGVGLVMYSAWRVLSVLVIRGSDLKDHLERVGYSFSGCFYAFLAFTALRNAIRGSEPDDSYTVERASRSLLSQGWGRALLVVAATVVIGVGLFFMRKAMTREFADNLQGVRRTWSGNSGRSRVVFVAGMIGWFGRGLVTALVGYFIGRAALRFDPSDASGFDRALRRVADGDYGAGLIVMAAAGLIVYGVYCLLSAPRREIAEDPS